MNNGGPARKIRYFFERFTGFFGWRTTFTSLFCGLPGLLRPRVMIFSSRSFISDNRERSA